MRADQNFRPLQIAVKAGRANFLYAFHFLHELMRRLFQQFRIVAAQHDRDVAPKASARLRLEINPCVCDILRSEEHTSELQSLMRISYAVFCLKKKNNTTLITQQKNIQCTPQKQ